MGSFLVAVEHQPPSRFADVVQAREQALVQNLPTPLPACNLWLADGELRQHVERHGGGWAAAQLSDLGGRAGGELVALGEQANLHRPHAPVISDLQIYLVANPSA